LVWHEQRTLSKALESSWKFDFNTTIFYRSMTRRRQQWSMCLSSPSRNFNTTDSHIQVAEQKLLIWILSYTIKWKVKEKTDSNTSLLWNSLPRKYDLCTPIILQWWLVSVYTLHFFTSCNKKINKKIVDHNDFASTWLCFYCVTITYLTSSFISVRFLSSKHYYLLNHTHIHIEFKA
jgi:hypothetical protein